MGSVNEVNVERVFTYQPATPAQTEAYTKIREAGIALAKAILDNVPNCADRSNALRLVREARMWANAAVALDGEI